MGVPCASDVPGALISIRQRAGGSTTDLVFDKDNKVMQIGYIAWL